MIKRPIKPHYQEAAVIPNTEPVPPAVFCKDCAHYRKVAGEAPGLYRHVCARPLGISLVTGKMAYTDRNCDNERKTDQVPIYCGRVGSKFVQRDTSED